MANLVGYARVSSEGQRDNTSLSTQREAIKDYCRRNSHKLVGFYEDVESGSTIELRDGFQWALETVHNVADGLVVFRLDRLTRNVEDGEKLKRTFNKQGKLLLSVSDSLDVKSEDGAFVYTINTAIAELERKRIKTRTDRGRRAKAELGGWIGGAPPYGFASLQRSLVELPKEQEIIVRIRSLYQDGYPANQIARYLNEQGIATKHRSKTGWTWQSVKRIVDGDPEVVAKLRESGHLLPASYWETTYGKTWHTSSMGSALGEESA